MATQKITPRQGGGSVSDLVQVYTSGATLVQTAGANYIIVNPASLIAALTLTFAVAWHPSGDLYILFGGTITSGNPTITAFTYVGGAGQTIVTSGDTVNIPKLAGESMRFRKNGNLIYRIL